MDIGMPLFVEEKYNGYLLMKFFEKKDYLKDFLDGKLYFNTSDYFSRIESEGRSDKDEGKEIIVSQKRPNNMAMNIEVHGGKAYGVVRDYSNHPENFVPGTVYSYSPAKNRYRKIICFYAAYLNTDTCNIEFPPLKMQKDFGKYAVVIPDRQAFYDLVVGKMKEIVGLKEAQLGFVEYIKESNIVGVYDGGPFKKKENFEWQNELRATFIDETREPVKLDLKQDLRKVAYPIMENDLNEIFLKPEGLYYPVYKERI